MPDEIDRSYTIVQTQPLKSGKCPNCGMWMDGFVQCPWCGGKKKVAKKPKRVVGRRWVGKVEIV